MALIDAMLCGEIAADDAARLKELLRSNEAARLLYVEIIDLQAGMLQFAGHNEPLTAQSIFYRRIGGQRSRRVAWTLAVVAILAVIMVPSAWYIIDLHHHEVQQAVIVRPIREKVLQVKDVQPEPPLVATLVRSVDATWGETAIKAKLPSGAQWRAGEWIELRSGTAIIEFENGVRCATSGASLLKVDDAQNCIFDIGTATFEVPESAVGFTVQTHGGSFVDFGTTFGVQVVADGSSEVHVLQGVVEARADGLGQADEQVLRLTSCGAARLDTTKGALSAVTFEPKKFSKPLAFSSGVVQFSESVHFWWQPLDHLIPEGLSSEKTVWLCRERSSVVLEQNFNLDQPDTASLPAGTRLDSYLLHFSPGNQDQGDKVVTGSITFASRVAGVLLSPEALNETDVLFCHPQTSLEINEESQTRRGSDEPKDQVSVRTGDDHTVDFRLTAVGGSLDQVRILLYANNE